MLMVEVAVAVAVLVVVATCRCDGQYLACRTLDTSDEIFSQPARPGVSSLMLGISLIL